MDLYDQDFYTWTLEQARLLRERRFAELDIEHLAEEIEDMGKREARSLRSQLERLIAHLLKWAYQPEARPWSGNSWRASIRDAREKLQDLLSESPGLKPKLPETFVKAYRGGVNWAVAETNLPETRFPAQCPWSLEQALDPGFWPNVICGNST
jgi:hypothetical protein